MKSRKRQQLRNSENSEKNENSILFYREDDDYGYFSNFSKHSVKIEEKNWPTTEHYFQAKKFEGTKWEEVVRKADTARKAKKLGSRRDLPFRKDWEKVKEKIMYTAIEAKFTQHLKLKKALLKSYPKKLVEHTKRDHYWADGNGKGKNRLGELLMILRKNLMEQKGNY